jgi:hypothetical protein
MAVNINKKAPAAKINRTPAPKITRNSGGTTYGQANDVNTPSSVTPNNPAVISELGLNLRSSVDDPVIAEVLAHGTSGRGDQIPADGDDDQLRPVSAESYPAAHGMVRQQNPDFFAKKTALPATTSKDGEAGPVRQP